MISSELLALFRDEINDAEAPYIHSTAALYAYMDEAQKNFCRWTEGIEDATTPEIVERSLGAGDDWITLDPRVLKLREVVNATTGRPYTLLNMDEATRQGLKFDGGQGVVSTLVSGFEKHKLRAWPAPSADTEFLLRVFRLPLKSITGEDQKLEIDEQHHTALLMWMKARAYGKDDLDTTNREKATEYEARFRSYCAEARKEQGRLRRVFGAVVYGGI